MSSPVVQEAHERLAALPQEERRLEFFRLLESYPPLSLERQELGALRRMAAPGPYPHHEFEILSGLVYPTRQYTPEETKIFAEHAEAVAALATARSHWEATARAKSAADAAKSVTGTLTADQDEALTVAWEAEREAREALGDAEMLEVLARPSSRRPLPTGERRLGVIARMRKAISG